MSVATLAPGVTQQLYGWVVERVEAMPAEHKNGAMRRVLSSWFEECPSTG